MTDPIDLILPRLENVRGSHGRYTARCPAHDDRGPSLAVTEVDDKMLLMHCFAGCDVHDIVQAVGLTISDLFPSDNYVRSRRYDRKPRENYRALIERGRHAAILVHVFAAQVVRDEKWHEPLGLTEDERIIFEGACEDLRRLIDA